MAEDAPRPISDDRWVAAARLIGLYDGDHEAAKDALARAYRVYFPQKAAAGG